MALSTNSVASMFSAALERKEAAVLDSINKAAASADGINPATMILLQKDANEYNMLATLTSTLMKDSTDTAKSIIQKIQ